jgi:hypothetical protein
MLNRKARAIAILSTIVCVAAADAGAQETFKSATFLEWEGESQKSYIGTSVTMAGVIAAQNMPSQAKCIDNWAAQQHAAGYGSVIEAMKRFPDHHPATVILAVMDKACGSFKYLKP